MANSGISGENPCDDRLVVSPVSRTTAPTAWRDIPPAPVFGIVGTLPGPVPTAPTFGLVPPGL
jgi:hypothetical protein